MSSNTYAFQKLNVPKGCDLPPKIKTVDDLLKLFGSPIELETLTLAQKKTSTLLLTKHYNYSSSSSINRLPSRVVGNLVALFGSTNKLFSYSHAQNILDSVLTAVTVNDTLGNASAIVQTRFLEGLFSLSPSIIDDCTSKSATISLLGTVSSAENLNALSRTAVVHLLTALSLSNSLMKSLPASNVSSLLTFIACKSPLETFVTLPPSTLFGFLDGLLNTVSDPKFKNGLPDSAIVTILHHTMTSRMLAVFPVHSLDRLLAVLSASKNLTNALPATNFVSLFNVLRTSPVIVKSLNDDHLANVLIAVASTPDINKNIPPSVLTGTFKSVSVYKPSINDVLENNLRKIFGITKTRDIVSTC